MKQRRAEETQEGRFSESVSWAFRLSLNFRMRERDIVEREKKTWKANKNEKKERSSVKTRINILTIEGHDVPRQPEEEIRWREKFPSLILFISIF